MNRIVPPRASAKQEFFAVLGVCSLGSRVSASFFQVPNNCAGGETGDETGGAGRNGSAPYESIHLSMCDAHDDSRTRREALMMMKGARDLQGDGGGSAPDFDEPCVRPTRRLARPTQPDPVLIFWTMHKKLLALRIVNCAGNQMSAGAP